MKILLNNYDLKDGVYTNSKFQGYWSNFSESDQIEIFKALKTKSTKTVIKQKFPQFYKMIYDQERCLGLELLNIDDSYVGIDYGCMWGNLLIHCSKKSKLMIGVDQLDFKFVKQD